MSIPLYTTASDDFYSRLLDNLIRALIGLALLSIPAIYVVAEPRSLVPPALPATASAAALLTVALIMGRRGRLVAATMTTVMVTGVLAWLAILSTPEPIQENTVLLAFPLVSVLMSAFLLSARVTATLAAVNGLILLLVARVVGLELQVVIPSLLLFFFLSVLVVLTARVIQRDRDQISLQAKEIAASEARFRALIDNSSDLVLVTGPKGAIKFASPAARGMLGYEPDRIVGLNVQELVHPDDQVVGRELYRGLLEDPGAVRHGEVRFIHDQGGVRWCQVAAQNLLDDPTIGGFVGNLRDVTDIRQQERELTAIGRLSKAIRDLSTRGALEAVILEQLASLAGTPDVSIEVLPANAETGGGRMPDSVGPLGASTSMPAEDDSGAGTDRAPIQPPGTRIPLVSADGEVGTLWIGRPLAEEEERLLSAFADIAASALHRTALHEQTQTFAQRIQQIIDTVPAGILLLDSDHVVRLANAAAGSYLPLLSQGAVDRPLASLGAARISDILSQSSMSVTLSDDTGASVRDFDIAARPVAGGAEGQSWVVVIRDITDERRQRERIQTQERLATVGQLAAGVAHDFNNILAVIALYSQLLKRHPQANKREDWLDTMTAQTMRASELIRQILDFSRQTVITRRRIDLSEFIPDVARLLERTLPARVRLTTEVPAEKMTVLADPGNLQQVIMNLALNASHAMPDGGDLTFRLLSVDAGGVGSESAGHADSTTSAPNADRGARGYATGLDDGRAPIGPIIRLEVQDTGEGIRPEHEAHIFEPFFTTKEPGQGTGLGLAQVYGIVKQHGGDIHVMSPTGGGTSFVIDLPRAEDLTEPTDSANLAPPPSGSHETILVVEDDDDTRAAVEDALLSLGYQVVCTKNGAEAMSILTAGNQTIDAVLTDLVMPTMSGEQLYRAIKQQGIPVGVLVMTGYPRSQEGRQLLEEPDIEWIQKPATMELIAEKLRRVLED